MYGVYFLQLSFFVVYYTTSVNHSDTLPSSQNLIQQDGKVHLDYVLIQFIVGSYHNITLSECLRCNNIYNWCSVSV